MIKYNYCIVFTFFNTIEKKTIYIFSISIIDYRGGKQNKKLLIVEVEPLKSGSPLLDLIGVNILPSIISFDEEEKMFVLLSGAQGLTPLNCSTTKKTYFLFVSSLNVWLGSDNRLNTLEYLIYGSDENDDNFLYCLCLIYSLYYYQCCGSGST